MGDKFTKTEKLEELEAFKKVRHFGNSIHIIIFELPFNSARGENEHERSGNDR